MAYRTMLFAAFGILIVLGVDWTATSFLKLSRSIIPGSNARPSASMEPYELVFRFAGQEFKDRPLIPPKRWPAEWRLTLPSAFLWSEINDNDAVGGTPDGEFHSAKLFAVPDPKSGAFTPGVFFGYPTQQSDGVIIDLVNGGGGTRWPAEFGDCLRSDDNGRAFGRRSLRVEICDPDPRVVRCKAMMLYQGWALEILMPKKRYLDDHQSYCKRVRAFLDDRTTSIDDIRRHPD